MGTAVLPARPRVTTSPWTVAPAALAFALGLAFLAIDPRPGDLAAHAFRAELFGREGFTIWNGQWYGGHHTPAYRERAVIEQGLPYLRLIWKSDDWRVYEVLLAAPMVIGQKDAQVVLEQFGSDELLLDVKHPGEAIVKVRWTPYWFAAGGCVERAGRWTRITARERGFMRLSTRFAPERVLQHGRRCDDA